MKPHFPLQCPTCHTPLTATQSLAITVKVPTDSTHPPVLQTFRGNLDQHGFLDNISQAAVRGLVPGNMPTSWCRCGSCNAELKGVWPPPRGNVGSWGHRFTTTTCPGCGADWTADESITMRVAVGEYGESGSDYLSTSLDEDGLIQDVDDQIANGNYSDAECAKEDCQFDLDTVEDHDYIPPGSWINDRGLDAEVLLNVAHFFDVNLWLHHPARTTHSMLDYENVIYRVCQAFQEQFASKDWDTDGDFWEQIDKLIDPLARIAKADPNLPSWSVEFILAEFTKL